MSIRPTLLRASSATLAAFWLAQPVVAGAQGANEQPTLVLMLTVDQLRPDYLTRFESQLSGGLGRLLRLQDALSRPAGHRQHL
jgi:hypothetical protein